MALITCPECGGKVSDKAAVCIHCGFPMDVAQKDDGKLYDMLVNDAGNMFHQSYIASDLKNFGIQKAEANKLLAQKNSVVLKGVKEENVPLLDEHFKRDCVVTFVPSKSTEPNPLNDTWREYALKIADRYNNVPRCPICNSTRIKKISFTRKAVGVATLGIFSKSARSQFVCEDCSYKF